jgi:hypothetical protein
MQPVFENALYKIEHDVGRKCVLLHRTATGLSEVDRDLLMAEVVAALRPLRGLRLLIDIRWAPGNNDPAIERSIQRFRRDVGALFPVVATLVASAVGRLQLNRLSRERSDAGNVGTIFLSEEEAMAYLMSRPL